MHKSNSKYMRVTGVTKIPLTGNNKEREKDKQYKTKQKKQVVRSERDTFIRQDTTNKIQFDTQKEFSELLNRLKRQQ